MKNGEDFPQCPGEDECPRYPNLPLYQGRKTAAEACGTCERRLTKPGHYRHLTFEAVQRFAAGVLRLDRLRSRGATFAYPNALEPWQWAGLETLEAAERRDSAERRELDAPPPAALTKPVQDQEYQRKKLQEIKRQSRGE